jgi:hypothetical protein
MAKALVKIVAVELKAVLAGRAVLVCHTRLSDSACIEQWDQFFHSM